MNARDIAIQHLLRANLPGWDSRKLPKPRDHDPKTDPRDIGLGLGISRAVTKNLLLLQHLIAHYSGRRLNRVDPLVQMVLAIALAQLRFFERLPPYAVVDQAVEQAKVLRLGKASGFINAVLRRALREPDAPLPDRSNAAEYARVVLSCPPDVFQRLVKEIPIEGALQLAQRMSEEAPLIVRRIGPAMPAAPEGVTITPHEVDGMYVVDGATDLLLGDWSAQGIAQAQDPTSAAIVSALVPSLSVGEEPERRLRICDRCCGVGTKTLQLGERFPGADILAIDPAAHRIHMLDRTIGQRHATDIRTHVGTAVPGDETPFDLILIDAPCSNSGVLIRRPEAKYRQTDASLRSLEKLQRQILADTIPFLAPGGTLVYSTCSIWPEENEAQVGWLQKQVPSLHLIRQETTFPTTENDPVRHHDGGFVAVLKSA